MDTVANDPKNADSNSNKPSTDTNEKLKLCRELLEGTINVGLSVIKEIVSKLLTSNGIPDQIRALATTIKESARSLSS